MTDAFEGSFSGLPADRPYPGVERRSFDGAGATVNRYDFDPGARFPRHRHPQEQITVVLRGSLELTVGDRSRTLTAGDYSVVPPNVEHGITAGGDGAAFVATIVPRRESADAYAVVDEVRVCDEGPELAIVEGGGTARAIVWPGTGAAARAMHRIRLDPGAGTVRLEHPGEAVYAVLEGAGAITDAGAGVDHAIERGSMVHLDGGTPYRFAAGAAGLDVVGGPAPVDPGLY
jgi:quercetin dioxygenase-like cupin family protein